MTHLFDMEIYNHRRQDLDVCFINVSQVIMGFDQMLYTCDEGLYELVNDHLLYINGRSVKKLGRSKH